MASVNKVILIGNCGRDPELRHLPSGQAVASISLATSSKRKDKSTGETLEETQWHRVTFFERSAEVLAEYVRKGDPIYVEGRIQYGKFTNKDGVEQNTCTIVGSSLQLLGSKGQQGAQQAPAQQRQAPPPRPAPAPRQQAAAAAPTGFDDMDDDIPFITSSMFYDITTSKQRRMRRRGA